MSADPLERIRRLTNELIIFLPEEDFRPDYVRILRDAGTPQITVDQVRDFRTPFGTHMLIATLTVTRARPQTWNLREYITRTLNTAGLKIEVSDVLSPARGKSYRVPS